MPDKLQYLGDTRLKFKDFEVRSGPRGMTTHFRVTCPSRANLIAYHNYVVRYGASVTFVGVDGGMERELAVEVPGLTSTTYGYLTELFFDQWELLTNECTDTIFANPLIIGGASPILDYNDRTVLSRLAREGGTVAAAVENCNTDITDGNLVAPAGGQFVAPAASGAVAQITLEILKGQTEYQRPTLVLRHTSYCSATATYNSRYTNEMCIFTPSQLLSEVGFGWTYNLPNRLYSKIASIPEQSAPSPETNYYTWGWLKKITREPVLPNFMVEVSTEYELSLWSNIRYELAI